MQLMTLCLIVKEEKILLGMKKKGFGIGKLNGFGGKVDPQETIEEAAIRELFEEVGLETNKNSLKKVGELTFIFPACPSWDQIVHVFLIDKWANSPVESEEMDFEWFDIEKIPFDEMWDDDKYWLPLVLNGKTIKANFSFEKDNETIKTKEIIEISLN